MAISGPVPPPYAWSTYTVTILYSYSAKSDVYLVKAKYEFVCTLRTYKSQMQNHFQDEGHKPSRVRMDQAVENTSNELREFCRSASILLEYSPAFASQSNSAVERLIQKHWMRTRALLFGSQLPYVLWGEAMRHAIWLRDSLPSKRVG